MSPGLIFGGFAVGVVVFGPPVESTQVRDGQRDLVASTTISHSCRCSWEVNLRLFNSYVGVSKGLEYIYPKMDGL